MEFVGGHPDNSLRQAETCRCGGHGHGVGSDQKKAGKCSTSGEWVEFGVHFLSEVGTDNNHEHLVMDSNQSQPERCGRRGYWEVWSRRTGCVQWLGPQGRGKGCGCRDLMGGA